MIFVIMFELVEGQWEAYVDREIEDKVILAGFLPDLQNCFLRFSLSAMDPCFFSEFDLAAPGPLAIVLTGAALLLNIFEPLKEGMAEDLDSIDIRSRMDFSSSPSSMLSY